MQPPLPWSSAGAALLAGLLLSSAPAAQSCDGLGVVKLPEADLGPAPAGGEQELPAIAAGEGAYLAAWPDDRAELAHHTTGIRSRDVYARRLGPDGEALDAPFRVAGGLGRKDDVRVSWNGETWLVTWTQEVPTAFWKAIAVCAARVGAGGEVLDVEPIVVRAYGSSSNVLYAVASDGDAWAVVCQGSSAGEALVEGHLVSAGGGVTPGPAPLLSSTSLWDAFELAFAGGRYLLAASSSNVQGRFLSPSLAPIGGAFTLAGGGEPALATDGTGFLVASVTSFNGSYVTTRTVSAAGALGAPQALTPASPVEYAFSPSVAWDGAQYVVAYTHGMAAPTAVRVARVTQAGAVVDFGGLPLATGADSRDPAIASLAAGAAEVAWARGAGVVPYVADVLAARVDAAGAASPALVLAEGRPRQRDPDLAAGGEGYLSVLASEHEGLVRVLAHRLDRFGHPLDAEPIEVAAGPGLRAPRAAWNGESFLVVWEDPQGLSFPSYEMDDVVLGRRLGPDGALLDAAPIPLLAGNMPDVGAVGSTFLVAASTPVTTQIRRIFAVRVDAAGAVLDDPPKAIGSNFARWPSVGSFDDRWIVAWQRNPTHDNPSSDGRYAVVLPDGSSLGETFVGGGVRPAAAASDQVGLVVLPGGNLGALRVAKDGSKLGGLIPLTAGPYGLEPRAAWTGEEFVVAWEDERNLEAVFDDRRDVFAARMLEDGAVLPFDGCPVSATPEHDQAPAVAGRDGDHLVAFMKYEPGGPAADVRVAYARGSEWTGIAGGIAGSHGVPVLEGDGALVPSGTLALALAGAAPLAPAFHVVGLSRVDLPLYGGLLVPAPDLVIAAATGPSGGALTVGTLPPVLPPGFQLWVQTAVLDPGAAQGIAASNAIEQ